jgi:subtilisin family serine protease
MKMLLVLLSLSLSGLVGCQSRSRLVPAGLEGSKSVLITNVKDVAGLHREAAAHNVKASGYTVVELRGAPADIARMRIDSGEAPLVARNEPIEVVRPEGEEADEQLLFMAKKEFGLDQFMTDNPHADGRGVIVGLIDDGISPSQSGFQRTSDGRRKFLARMSNSSLLDVAVSESAAPGAFGRAITEPRARALYGVLDESTLIRISPWAALDVNGNNGLERLSVVVLLQSDAAATRVCVDSNANEILDDGECFGTFKESGEFGSWDVNHIYTIAADFNPQTSKVSLSFGERPDDSHGEGVASILAGSKIAGRFDGVAPGAQLLDYDLSEPSGNFEEEVYTLATFLKALEWMGQQDADVVNISYSLFFMSAQSQEFMRRALDNLVTRYGFVISFSGGNNGPGFGSLNRRGLYPSGSIVAGAYVSKEMDEAVHGVTGLPAEGRVIWYSSRGPGYDSGQGPVLISPLASLTHSDPTNGFRAFSGTSSAAPAAGGLAAVLISAARRENLPIDPVAVVHAMRLSARRLPGVAFVDQGYGLPQAKAALEHYRRLVAGQDFAFVKSGVTGVTSPDGAAQSGVVLTEVDGAQDVEVRLTLQGVPAGVVPARRRQEMLRPLEIRMSQTALRGAGRLWLSTSNSAASVTVKTTELINSVPKGRAWLGEVEVRDGETQDLKHIVPITFLNRHNLETEFVAPLNISPEDAERFFFNVQNNESALRIRLRVDARLRSGMTLRVYNPSRRLITSTTVPARENEWLIPVNEVGEYQVTVVRQTGTEALLTGELSVQLLQLSNRTDFLVLPTANSATPAMLRINNTSTSAVAVKMSGRPRPVTLLDSPLSTDAAGDLRVDARVTGPADIRIAATPAFEPIQSLRSLSCFNEVLADSGSVVARSFDTKISLEAGQAGQLRSRCRFFDGTYVDQRVFRVVVTSEPGTETKYFETNVRLEPGLNRVEIPTWLSRPASGTQMNIVVEPLVPSAPAMAPVVVGPTRVF